MPIVGDLLADRYRIDGPVGAGGMASVYRATDLRLDRAVAVKVLSANLAADATLASRFEREARALAAAANPSVVTVFDVAPGDPETGREPFYVMELCDGGTLGDRLSAAGRLEPAELIPALVSVAEGLAELHRRGIVHRDVKPANIVYLGDRPKLADFGLARSGEQDLTTLTADGMTVGTLAFLAPELLGGSPATHASDVYALGVTAFQGLTGRLPKEDSSIGALIENRMGMAPTVSSVAPELGTRFDRTIASALAVDPADRPGADGFAAHLAAAQARGTRRSSASRSGSSSSTRPFFDAADPFPKTAVSVPLPVTPDPDGGDTDAPSLPEETVAEVALPAGPPRSPPAAGTPAVSAAPPAPTRARKRRAVARPPRPRSLTDRPGLLVLGLFMLVVLVLAGLSTVLGGGSNRASPSAPLVVIAPSPSSAISPSPASFPASPSPSPLITPSPEPAARALAAVDDAIAAIEAARGGGGLKGKEANELERLAGDVRAHLRSGDYDEAREAAEHLRERIEKVGDELDRTRRQRLEAAVAALLDAIPED
jgi:serine/threonine protein kinase